MSKEKLKNDVTRKLAISVGNATYDSLEGVEGLVFNSSNITYSFFADFQASDHNFTNVVPDELLVLGMFSTCDGIEPHIFWL